MTTIKESSVQTTTEKSLPANQVKITIMFILVTLLFAPAVLELVTVWRTDDDYSHGFFVIPIALYMVWHKRQNLLSGPLKPLWIAFPVFMAGAATYVISFVARFHTLTYLSIIVVILGLLLFLTGWTSTRKLLFPVLFLCFMFPIPSAYYILITNPLKLMITEMSSQIIHLIGIPVYRDGNLLFFATTQLEVAEACSGIRSLYSYLMLGCIFALITKKTVVKILLIASTAPLAVMVNVLRVTGTGILAQHYGSRVAQGFFHEFSGFVLFALGFLMLFLEYYLFTLMDPDPAKSNLPK